MLLCVDLCLPTSARELRRPQPGRSWCGLCPNPPRSGPRCADHRQRVPLPPESLCTSAAHSPPTSPHPSPIQWPLRCWVTVSVLMKTMKVNYLQSLTGASQHFCIKKQGHPTGLWIAAFRNPVVLCKQIRKGISKGPFTKARGSCGSSLACPSVERPSKRWGLGWDGKAILSASCHSQRPSGEILFSSFTSSSELWHSFPHAGEKKMFLYVFLGMEKKFFLYIFREYRALTSNDVIWMFPDKQIISW